MQVVKAPDKDHSVETDIPRLFLAGCANTNWRKSFTESLEGMDVIVYDPKRDNWDDMTDKDSFEQIKWEFENLRKSDIIVFWFNKGSVCPITLLEYGMWGLSKGTPIVVYIENGYEKEKDIILQTLLARPDIHICTLPSSFANETIDVILQWHERKEHV